MTVQISSGCIHNKLTFKLIFLRIYKLTLQNFLVLESISPHCVTLWHGLHWFQHILTSPTLLWVITKPKFNTIHCHWQIPTLSSHSSSLVQPLSYDLQYQVKCRRLISVTLSCFIGSTFALEFYHVLFHSYLTTWLCQPHSPIYPDLFSLSFTIFIWTTF